MIRPCHLRSVRPSSLLISSRRPRPSSAFRASSPAMLSLASALFRRGACRHPLPVRTRCIGLVKGTKTAFVPPRPIAEQQQGLLRPPGSKALSQKRRQLAPASDELLVTQHRAEVVSAFLPALDPVRKSSLQTSSPGLARRLPRRRRSTAHIPLQISTPSCQPSYHMAGQASLEQRPMTTGLSIPCWPARPQQRGPKRGARFFRLRGQRRTTLSFRPLRIPGPLERRRPSPFQSSTTTPGLLEILLVRSSRATSLLRPAGRPAMER